MHDNCVIITIYRRTQGPSLCFQPGPKALQMALDGLSATEWASYEPCVALVCLWQGVRVSIPLAGAGASSEPQSWVRAGGWAGTGLGMKFPSSAHQSWGQSIPWHTPKSASTGCGCCKHSPRDPERSRVRALGGCSHPGAPPQSPLTAWAHGMSLCSHISGKREMKSSPVIIY